jgi:hypothetical protein
MWWAGPTMGSRGIALAMCSRRAVSGVGGAIVPQYPRSDRRGTHGGQQARSHDPSHVRSAPLEWVTLEASKTLFIFW